MAKVIFTDPVDHVEGRLQKDGTIHRQKTYRDATGRVLALGKPEAFIIANPRDFEKKPQQGAELENFNLFRQATQLALQERANPERMAYWTERFQAQLEKPEADAPIDKKTGLPKTYCRLDAFIRACIFRQLRATR